MDWAFFFAAQLIGGSSLKGLEDRWLPFLESLKYQGRGQGYQADSLFNCFVILDSKPLVFGINNFLFRSK